MPEMTDLMKMSEKRKREATMREVYDLRVFVVGGGFQYIQMFYDAGFKGARSVEDAHVVCFTGGEDVDPAMYGEKPLPKTNFNKNRDEQEAFIYGQTIGLKKPMVGICRGSQFLNVMNGGKLWQHVNNHCRGHSIIDVRSGEVLEGMTSTHHQQMIPSKDAVLLAMVALSTHKENAEEIVSRQEPQLDDTEAVWYKDTMTLCFQPHPEFGQGQCRDYFFDLVDEFILPSCC